MFWPYKALPCPAAKTNIQSISLFMRRSPEPRRTKYHGQFLNSEWRAQGSTARTAAGTSCEFCLENTASSIVLCAAGAAFASSSLREM
jgi:hypothetical protein